MDALKRLLRDLIAAVVVVAIVAGVHSLAGQWREQ
jgi:hypothetical protein